MDSGNSGSLHSSSGGGGDEEYDSRATDSLSAFFNSSSSSTTTTNHHFFDPLPYLHPNPNPFLNLDSPWPPMHQHPSNPNTSLTATPSNPPPPQPQPSSATPRTSKKRSRASRRAPTTVLTTDTSNFRAMVQEFTGIPAPPFASSIPRPRFDSLLRPSTTFLDTPPPPFLLRPFAHKPPSNANYATTSTNATTSNTTIANTYQLPPSSLGFSNQHHPQTLNQSLNFQSILQSPTKYSLPSMSIGGDIGLSTIMGGTMQSMNRGVADLPIRWPSEGSAECGSNNLTQLRPTTTDFASSQHANNNKRKMNYTAPVSSELIHAADKGPESLPVRGEGLMESWNICSSD